ncbi:MAG: hypothetical protein Q8R70_05575, partial [Methanoregula sp.]|nr:hypothetical protein [Methanoregula sp.]
MLSSLLLCGPAVAESQIYYCPYGQTDPVCIPWGTTTVVIHETEGGDLGKRIVNGKYECTYEMLNYNTFRLEKCENLINYQATANYPFTIPAGVNLSRVIRYPQLFFGGPGDSRGGTNLPDCSNVRGHNCEEPVYSVNGVEMTDWIDTYGATPSFGRVSPAILHTGTNTLTIKSKPLWHYVDYQGYSGGPFYTGKVEIDDVSMIIQTSYSPSEMPELHDLTMSPDILLATHDITISPVVKPGSPDWKIVGISYYVFDQKTGDMDFHRVLPDTGELTYRPAPENYGRKWLKAKMHVEDQLTGHREISEITVPISIYFEKGQYPNWVKDDGVFPNWYKYWMEDGAVPGLSGTLEGCTPLQDCVSVIYADNVPGYGATSPLGHIGVFSLAGAVHYNTPLVLPTTVLEPAGESFGGPDINGIDSVAEIIAHENYHKWVDEQWKTGASFDGKVDSDFLVDAGTNKTFNDKLPDDYETATSKTHTTITDTYLLEGYKHPMYRYYGDNEYMAMRAGNGGRGIPGNDWAYPGKQAGGVVEIPGIKPPAAGACGGMCDIVSESLPKGEIETPADSNANGKYDTLTATNDITISWPGTYEVVAILSGDQGAGPEVITVMRNQTQYDNGTYSVSSVFLGTTVSSAGIDGPYNVTFQWKHELNENSDPESLSWETGTYVSTDFEPVSAGFSGMAAASPAGRNLSAITPLIINKAGEYTIEGYLQDPDGQIIAHAAETRTFSAGSTNADLVFDGTTIAAHHRDGTYRLVNFRILDSTGTTVSRLVNAGTVTIDSSDFGTMVALLTDSFSAAGSFPNSDGKFESLLVTAGITAPYEGRYYYSASLFD